MLRVLESSTDMKVLNARAPPRVARAGKCRSLLLDCYVLLHTGIQVDRIIYIPPKMFAAKTDIPCMLMDNPYILSTSGAQPR